jgi:hypothetical protein
MINEASGCVGLSGFERRWSFGGVLCCTQGCHFAAAAGESHNVADLWIECLMQTLRFAGKQLLGVVLAMSWCGVVHVRVCVLSSICCCSAASPRSSSQVFSPPRHVRFAAVRDTFLRDCLVLVRRLGPWHPAGTLASGGRDPVVRVFADACPGLLAARLCLFPLGSANPVQLAFTCIANFIYNGFTLCFALLLVLVVGACSRRSNRACPRTLFLQNP